MFVSNDAEIPDLVSRYIVVNNYLLTSEEVARTAEKC